MKQSTQEIINRVEGRLSRYIFDPVNCNENCKCSKCFHKALDRLLASSAESLVEMKVGTDE